MTPKRREPLILFLDDSFDSPESFDSLTSQGFSVERFRNHFTRDGRKIEGVADPAVITLCSKNKWLLVTADCNMQQTHVEEIKRTDVAILATANAKHPVSDSVAAIVKAKAKIERMFKKQGRPWFARISKEAVITRAVTIGPEVKNRRTRPSEKVSKQVSVQPR